MLLAISPNRGIPDLPGETTTEPAFGLPALWVQPAVKDEAVFRGCTVVDPASVLTTHLTEVARDNMAELLSFAETQKLLDDLPREQQKLVSDLIPGQTTVGGVQRLLQGLLAERVSIRDLPTILEGIQEVCSGSPSPHFSPMPTRWHRNRNVMSVSCCFVGGLPHFGEPGARSPDIAPGDVAGESVLAVRCLARLRRRPRQARHEQQRTPVGRDTPRPSTA